MSSRLEFRLSSGFRHRQKSATGLSPVESMELPFSRDAFLDVFGTYNTTWWPVVVGLWFATLVAFLLRLMDRDRSQWTWGLLAIQWLWSALVYHAQLFAAINPAAWLFTLLFLVQAGLLVLQGVVEHRLRFQVERGPAWLVGSAFVAYGLLYPFIALVSEDYPRVPTFGVPCPITLVTVGFLLLTLPPVPRLVAIVPALWAAIGGSAAFVLSMPADLILPVAGIALVGRLFARGG